MANLTISVNNETLKRARIRALENNTSVNAVLNDYLEQYAGMKEVQHARQEALRRILQTAKAHSIDRGGKLWRRDELYER
jgi:23S rRNA U2552 (ribose-2'-O)-methylase RlmE/FtsJ